MNVRLTEAERTQLRQWQKQRRDNDGYVKVTVLLMLDAGRPLATVVQDLGLNEATVYRYARVDELAVLEAHVERGEAVLYYADAAHPTHNTRYTRAWCQVGHERPLLTVSGRERVNLNAALNAYRRLYEQLLAAHPDKARIYVICDNARYYKNKALREWLADKPICQVPSVSAALLAQSEPD